MAKIVITVKDTASDEVDIQVEYEGISKDGDLTHGEKISADMIDFIVNLTTIKKD